MSRARKYVLEDHTPVPCDDLLKWAKWYETHERQVASDEVVISVASHTLPREDYLVRVSTVFLALNHNLSGDGPPLLFETMVFGGEHDQEQERYGTWEEAEAGHAKWLAKVKRT